MKIPIDRKLSLLLYVEIRDTLSKHFENVELEYYWCSNLEIVYSALSIEKFLDTDIPLHAIHYACIKLEMSCRESEKDKVFNYIKYSLNEIKEKYNAEISFIEDNDKAEVENELIDIFKCKFYIIFESILDYEKIKEMDKLADSHIKNTTFTKLLK